MSKRKWCLPATCSMCNRTCTHFWGEVADHWACDGHYIIMNSNAESWHLPKDESGKHVKSEVKKWAKDRKKGIEWLKANPNPEQKPVCDTCGEEAKCQDEGKFFCMEHWPLRE